MSDRDVSRRQFFMKVGIALNGLAALVLATPVVGYLLAPLLRGDGGRYRQWIDLGELDEFPEGQTRLAKYKNPISNPWDGETDNIPVLGTPRAGRTIPGLRDQLRPSRMSRALVPAVRAVHVSLPRRRVLPGWLARLRSARTRIV